MAFFIPLGITGFLLAFNGTIVNAGLARLSSPVLLISSFAVARTFMQFIISPMHMIRPMFTALTYNGRNYAQVKKFALAVTVAVTALLALFTVSGMAKWVFSTIMQLPENTVHTAVLILQILIFYPIGLFFKDFYHGVLIKFEKTSLITYATLIRIVAVSLLVVQVGRLSFVPGTLLAGIIFLSGTYTEGLSALIFSRKAVGNIVTKLDAQFVHSNEIPHNAITGKFIFNFYWPLVITTCIKTIAMPVINTGLAKSLNPELAITTFAVTWGLISSLINPLNMFHQVSIKFVSAGNKDRNKQVLQFGIFLGSIMSVLIALLAFTPLGGYTFEKLIGVDAQISTLSVSVLKYAVPMPLITVLREYLWGILIMEHSTRSLGLGKLFHLITLIATMLVIIVLKPVNSALIGIMAILLADIMELIIIVYTFMRKRLIL